MTDAVVAVLYVVALATGGGLAVRGILGKGRVSRSMAAACGLPVGTFLFSYAAFLMMLVGIPFRPATVISLLVLLVALAATLVWWRRDRVPIHRTKPAITRESGGRGIAVLLGAVLVVLVTVRVHETLRMPWRGDGLAFWRLKAVAIAAEGTVRTPSFTHPLVVHNHKRYPLLQPIANAGLLVLEPDLAQPAQMAVHAAFLLGLYGLLYATLRACAGHTLTCLLLILLSLSPAVRASGGYVSTTVALYLLGGAVFARRWRQERTRGSAVVFLLMIAGLAFTKNEGAVLAGFVYLSLFLPADSGREVNRRAVLGHAGMAVLVLCPWILFKLSLPATFDTPAQSFWTATAGDAGAPVRFLYATYLTAYQALAVGSWGPMWLLVGLALLQRGDPVLRVIPAAALVLYLVTAAFHPEELVSFVPNTVTRVLTQLAPVGLLLVASRVRSGFPKAFTGPGDGCAA